MSWLGFGEMRFPDPHSTDPSVSLATLLNHRLDVLRVSKHFDVDLEGVIRDRKRAGGYTEIRNMSEEELLDLSHKMADDLSASKLSDYRFKGLTNEQALVVVSHIKDEMPAFVDEYVRLPGEDEGPRLVVLSRSEDATVD